MEGLDEGKYEGWKKRWKDEERKWRERRKLKGVIKRKEFKVRENRKGRLDKGEKEGTDKFQRGIKSIGGRT